MDDLLGINTGPQAAPTGFSMTNSFGQMGSPAPTGPTSSGIPANLLPGNYNPGTVQPFTEHLKKTSLLTEGVLHQDEYIQIGYKSEYSNGLGRMMIYYGNTSGTQLNQFRAVVTSAPFVSLNAQPVASVIEPRTQMQQLITMTSSVADFGTFPTLDISFVANGKPVQLSIQLAIVITKFVEPLNIQGGDFFQQWKQLDTPGPHNTQSVVKSTRPVDIPAVSKVLTSGLKFTLLNNVDPNMNNIVGTGNFATPTGRTPFLFRIESNPEHSMYRLSVRSSSPYISAGVLRILDTHLA